MIGLFGEKKNDELNDLIDDLTFWNLTLCHSFDEFSSDITAIPDELTTTMTPTTQTQINHTNGLFCSLPFSTQIQFK